MDSKEKHDQMMKVSEKLADTIKYSFPDAKDIIVMFGWTDDEENTHSLFFQRDAEWGSACRVGISCIGMLHNHFETEPPPIDK